MNCERCGGPPDHSTETCCSSHEKRLCHACYRRTHFVEICGLFHLRAERGHPMTTQGPAVTGQGEGGEVLGEEGLARLLDEVAYGDCTPERALPELRAVVAQARDTFASARSEQDRLAEWVLANCPGEPSQDGGVVDTVIRLITSARAEGAAEEREVAFLAVLAVAAEDEDDATAWVEMARRKLESR